MQLRLELAESPAPAVALWELVGEEQRQTAMALLAALIAQTVAGEEEEETAAVSERSKLTASHLRRAAFVYLRQSSQTQVERNVESTDRQYALVARAVELGFAREQVVVIDEDLGISGSGLSDRSGFARLAAEVALGHAGLVLGLEVSRLARNNVDWYRLLDLCGVTDTVIGDADGLYHPGSFNDRLLLGLKGTMSRGRVARAPRPAGGRDPQQGRSAASCARRCRSGWYGARRRARSCSIPTKRSAARSRRSSTGSRSSVRSGRCGCGCAARGCSSRCAASRDGEIEWVIPTYHQIHSVLESPVYAGAYAFGKTRRERYVDEHGNTRQRIRRLPQADWGVLIWDHHPGFIDKATFEANRERIAGNTRPRAHEPGGAVREGRRCCKGSLCAAAADASSRCTIKAAAGTRAPPITAQPASWSRTAAAGACGSAAGRSTRPSPARCSPRSPPPA